MFFSYRWASSLRFFEPLVRTKGAIEPIIRARMARAYQEINRVDDAINCFKLLAEAHPRNIHFLTELGKLYTSKGNLATASEYTSQALAIRRIQSLNNELDPAEYDAIMEAGARRAKQQYQKDDENRAIEPYNEHTEIQFFEILIGRYEMKPPRGSVMGGLGHILPPDFVSNMEAQEELTSYLSKDGPFQNLNAWLKDQRNEGRPSNRRKRAGAAKYQEAIASWSAENETPRGSSAISKTREMIDSIPLLHLRLLILRPRVNAGDQGAIKEWMGHAEAMMMAFGATTRVFQHKWRPGTTGKDERFNDSRGPPADLAGLDGGPESGNTWREITKSISTTKPDMHEHAGVPVSDWLDVFCRFAFLTAKQDQSDKAYEVLSTASKAAPFFQNADHLFHIHVVWLVCALILGDEETLYQATRWLVKAHPTTTDSFRIYAAMGLLFNEHEPRAYSSAMAHKFFLRRIKRIDLMLLEPENREKYRDAAYDGLTTNSPAQMAETLEDDGEESNMLGVVSQDPMLLVLYGHITCMTGSYSHALHYYLRAFALDSNNAMTALCIGVAHLNMALKDKAENRQQSILQAMAFFGEYRRLRLQEESIDKQAEGPTMRLRMEEVEFNEARLWHQLGLLHLAVPAYERCLAVEGTPPVANGSEDNDVTMIETDGPQRRDDDNDGSDDDPDADADDYKREAAFALQQIYALGGDSAKAREITQKWLVF